VEGTFYPETVVLFHRYKRQGISEERNITACMAKVDRNVKFKVTLEQTMKADRGSRGIAIFFL
jgi:hypothetical protein